MSGDMLSVVTAPLDWREYAAGIVNLELHEIELPDITAQQLLDLAQEYHSQSARGEKEVGRAAARAQVAATEQARTTDEAALERGAAAVDAAAAAERDHAAGEVSSPSARARRSRRGRTQVSSDIGECGIGASRSTRHERSRAYVKV